jgi:glycosyltransferase involved in cell wall biosynthesis
VEHERHATFKALKLDVDKVMAENGKIFARKNPRIRVVAIAKNEEKALWGFFDQFKPVTRDWCLLDTGSTDQTVEVAKAMGVRVERGEFRDFASARNEALDRFGKDCDWVIMLDPDERLDGHTIEHLRELVFNAQHDIYLAPLQAVYPNKTTRQFVSKAFLFRSSPAIRWVFKVHEKLIGSHEQALVENGMINHIIELHEDERRKTAGAMYDRLAAEEPYFTDSEYRARMRREWPILDYDRMDDDRIQKIKIGPLVSVVIPTYRRPRMVVNAIRSALNQDYANLEVLVIGDNCPDLHNVQLADRVRVFNLPKNHGAGGAEPRNYGIRLAAGRLIAYLDDDNQWTRNHVSSLYEAMRKTGSAFAFSSMSVNGRDLKFKSLKQFEIDTSCVLHEKDLIDKYGWWKDRTEVGYAHDWEFFSRWVNEKWVCSRMPTLLYNADSSGQKEFLLARVQEEADCASSRNDRVLH